MKTATTKCESIHTGSKKKSNHTINASIRPGFQLAIAIAAMLWLAANAASAQTVLYTFNNETGDVDGPEGALIADAAGNLYGTAWSGGPALLGGIFELSPPTVPGGPWTEQTLYTTSQAAPTLQSTAAEKDKAPTKK